MNPVVLQFANGNVFFIGMVMVMGAAAFCLRISDSSNFCPKSPLAATGWLCLNSR
jgi:hypothetical protein